MSDKARAELLKRQGLPDLSRLGTHAVPDDQNFEVGDVCCLVSGGPKMTVLTRQQHIMQTAYVTAAGQILVAKLPAAAIRKLRLVAPDTLGKPNPTEAESKEGAA